jgi:hypothetical protein
VQIYSDGDTLDELYDGGKGGGQTSHGIRNMESQSLPLSTPSAIEEGLRGFRMSLESM